MFVALALSLLLPAGAPGVAGAVVPAARPDDPPIKLWLSDDLFERGDRARVRVETADDGYLVVLRADADGRVRVLFPLDPGDDNFVRGGRKYELRGRGDRAAFAVDEREGSGTVLAARSVTPFRFDEFVRGDHWDYRVLSAQQVGDDAEAGLLDIVQRMAGDHYDYDVVTYTVSRREHYRGYAGWYDPFYSPCFGCGSGSYGPRFRFGVSIVFGHPYRYRPFYYRPIYYDPFFYDPFFYDPFYYDPFSYRPHCWGCYHGGFGYVTTYTYYRPAYRPIWGGGYVFRDIRRSPPFVLPRERMPVTAIGPRVRVPEDREARRGAPVPGRGERPVARERTARPLEQRLERLPLVRSLIGERLRERSSVARPAREARAPVSRERVEAWSRPEVRRVPEARAPMSRERGESRARPEARGGGRTAPSIRSGNGGGGRVPSFRGGAAPRSEGRRRP